MMGLDIALVIAVLTLIWAVYLGCLVWAAPLKQGVKNLLLVCISATSTLIFIGLWLATT